MFCCLFYRGNSHEMGTPSKVHEESAAPRGRGMFRSIAGILRRISGRPRDPSPRETRTPNGGAVAGFSSRAPPAVESKSPDHRKAGPPHPSLPKKKMRRRRR